MYFWKVEIECSKNKLPKIGTFFSVIDFNQVPSVLTSFRLISRTLISKQTRIKFLAFLENMHSIFWLQNHNYVSRFRLFATLVKTTFSHSKFSDVLESFFTNTEFFVITFIDMPFMNEWLGIFCSKTKSCTSKHMVDLHSEQNINTT